MGTARGHVASAGMSHKENLHPKDARDGKTAKFRSGFVLLDVAGVLQYLENLAFLVASCGSRVCVGAGHVRR